MPHTVLSVETQRELRNTLVLGVQYLATTAKDGKANDKYYHGFHDVELGVSTNPLTSSNCENLTPDESAYFIRVKDVMPNLAAEPKSILFGVVMMKKTEAPSTFTTKKLDASSQSVRMWSEIPPKWESGGDTLTEEEKNELIQKIAIDILLSVSRACEESSSLPNEMVVS